MASFDVDYDSASWVLVPVDFPTAFGESEREWAAGIAREQRRRGYVQTRDSGTLEDYFLELMATAKRSSDQVEHDSLWALTAPGAPGFLMASIDLEDADEPFDDFVGAVSGPRANQYEPAVVTAIEVLGLGDGVRIVRHDLDHDRQVYVSIYYVFRIDGRDLLLSAQSVNPATIEWAVPLFEQLLAGVNIKSE